ncbi:MAG: hypothetical protein IPJ65_28985 [Archangiaceae bacterium]|nr:hypothetical protein [Archangiaceae bacterium]
MLWLALACAPAPAPPAAARSRAAVSLSAEQPVTTPRRATEQGVGAPAVAFNGSVYLVVWSAPSNGGDVHAARVDALGNLLDPTARAIGESPLPQTAPDVAALPGGDFLVAWAEVLDGGSNIKATRVSAAGVELDPSGLTLASGAGARDRPAVASGQGQFAVAWQDGVALAAVAVSSSGAPVASPTTFFNAAGPALAFDGTQYLLTGIRSVTTQLPNWVMAQRLTSQLAPIDPGAVMVAASPLSSFFISARPSSDGAGFMVAWSGLSSGGQQWVSVGRFTSAGAVPDDGGVYLDERFSRSPTLSPLASGYLLTMNGTSVSGGLQARFVSAGAQGTPDAGYLIGGTVGLADSAFDGNRTVLTVYQAGAARELAGVQVRDTLDGGTPFNIGWGYSAQSAPAIAFNGSEYLAAWSEFLDGGWDVVAARLSAQGSSLDPSGIDVSSGPGDQTAPTVVWTGAAWLVVWADARSDQGDLYFSRVDSNGAVLEPAGGTPLVTGAGQQTRPVLSSDGALTCLAYADVATQRLARLTPTGGLLGTTTVLAAAASSTVVASSGQCLVGWVAATGTVSARRLDANGAFVDPAAVVLDANAGNPSAPSVAAGAGGFLVGWSVRDSFGNALPRLRLFTEDGGVSARQSLEPGMLPSSPPSIVAAGGAYQVMWAAWEADWSPELKHVEVGFDGVVIDGGVLTGDRAVSLTAPAVGPGVLAYLRHDPTAHQARLVAREVQWSLAVAPDGGAPDGGAPDAGGPDAGGGDGGVDAGRADAGPGDGGRAEASALAVGCGCSASPTAGWALGLLLALARRRVARER